MSFSGVAISGKAGAGKNFFARCLQEELARRGEWGVEVGFADAVKREVLRLYGVTKEMPGGRERCLEIGHGRRQDDPDYWVRQLAHHLVSLRAYGLIPIITDMRYLSELEWAQRAGLLTVRLDASVHDRMLVLHRRGEDPDFAVSEHPSETELEEERFHVRFWNPHGEAFDTLPRHVLAVADLLLGVADYVAA